LVPISMTAAFLGFAMAIFFGWANIESFLKVLF